ncbi:acyl-CoA dehydrogenase [Parasphingopyxis sp. CP4]|uniref:acyl-CoA dehydrogenase family protein n=1 Tax=Parasphingopyxis sp. CP4 TaxID=2724527 RepID=UPI0015A2F906|nr:acyl-CoA dehydrogenase family protein [Parasphingopyxis sp. CP4]QLC22025.1 acyl-CoA dehydrogenase [Parasphingopyxis sp. CP4]
MPSFAIHPFATPDTASALRQQVRDIVADCEADWDAADRANSWSVADPGFSRRLGQEGLVGMIWPKRYGGHERDPLERYIVLEELLAAGAPVGAHWIADRQTGPLLLRYGTEEQREEYLPGMAKGETYACIGLSEPGAGSDLAGVKTSARKTDTGWIVNGQKVWTSGAHRAHAILALVRTEPGTERQAGLSQLLIDMDTPGITVRPIVNLAGQHDFNEIFFEEVEVPATALVGEEGNGWKQVTAELALERSGPERYLSSYALFRYLIAEQGNDPTVQSVIGQLTAELWTLRQMSMSTAAKLANGEDPVVEAAIVKDLGNSYEQDVPTAIQAVLGGDFDSASDSALARTLALLVQTAPSFSLRGGTREILRGIIARGLGLR